MGIIGTYYNIEENNNIYIEQKPYVGDDGIYVPVEAYVPQGCVSAYRCVMTKEMFIDAYKKYIDPKNPRLYKGGWKRRKHA